MSVFETWRPVISYKGRFPGYHASSLGRIRRDRDGRILKLSLAGRDRHYYYATLSDGKLNRPKPVAILVAEAFLGLKGARQVNHKNGIRTDNRPENFEYVTHHENHLHAGRFGLKAWGERHAMHKLTADQVREIRASHRTQRDLAGRYGVTRGTIDSVRNRRTWRHLDEPGISSVANTASTQFSTPNRE